MYQINNKIAKLLLATMMIIPAMGYCGLMGWLTGYPEIKAKIEQRLEQKYHGDKFEVWDVSYSSNLGGYNFKAKDIDKDLESGGSCDEKENAVVDNFRWMILSAQWKELLKPVITKYSNNYIMFGGLGTQSPVGKFTYENSPTTKALNNLFKNNLTAQEWVSDDHLYINATVNLFIGLLRTPQGMFKALKLAEELNNYLRSMDLYSYKLSITPMELPKDFNLYQELYDKGEEDKHYQYMDFLMDGEFQKYAWGWLELYSCAKVGEFEKSCNTQYLDKDEKSRLKMISKLTSADRVHSLEDIAKDFHLYNKIGKPTFWNKRDPNYSTWHGGLRSYTLLFETKYYSQIQNLNK